MFTQITIFLVIPIVCMIPVNIWQNFQRLHWVLHMNYQSIPFLVVTRLSGSISGIPFTSIHSLVWSIFPSKDLLHMNLFQRLRWVLQLKCPPSLLCRGIPLTYLPKVSLRLVLPQQNILYDDHDLPQGSLVTTVALFHAFLFDNHYLSSLDTYFHLTCVHMHTKICEIFSLIFYWKILPKSVTHIFSNWQFHFIFRSIPYWNQSSQSWDFLLIVFWLFTTNRHWSSSWAYNNVIYKTLFPTNPSLHIQTNC